MCSVGWAGGFAHHFQAGCGISCNHRKEYCSFRVGTNSICPPYQAIRLSGSDYASSIQVTRYNANAPCFTKSWYTCSEIRSIVLANPDPEKGNAGKNKSHIVVETSSVTFEV